MGLLSNRVGRDELKPGDHIYSWRTAYIYAHHGIYIGDNKVIHFTRRGQEVGTGTILDVLLVSSGPAQTHIPCPTCIPREDSHGVVASCLNCFLSGGILYRFQYSVSPALFLAKARGGTCTLAVSDPCNVVTHRAEYLKENGFGCYNLFKNNCEDFAIYCKTGLLVVDKSTMGQSGQAVSIIGGPLAAVMSTPLRLLTTNVFGMAATAVGVYCASRYVADIGIRRDVVKVAVEELTRRLATGSLNVDDRVLQPMMLPMAGQTSMERVAQDNQQISNFNMCESVFGLQELGHVMGMRSGVSVRAFREDRREDWRGASSSQVSQALRTENEHMKIELTQLREQQSNFETRQTHVEAELKESRRHMEAELEESRRQIALIMSRLEPPPPLS